MDDDILDDKIKNEACEVANKMLRIAEGTMPAGSNEERIQVFLLALSITLGKFITAVAVSEEAREEILEGVNDNVKQVFQVFGIVEQPKGLKQ